MKTALQEHQNMKVSTLRRRGLMGLAATLLAATALSSPAALAQFTPQSGFWAVAGEAGGRGVVIEISQAGEMYASTLVYNDYGLPTWYVVNTDTSVTGQRSGQLQKFQAGQQLNGPYSAPTFAGYIGNATFLFDSTTSGTLSISGLGEMSIRRYDIIAGGVASGAATGAPAAGWWWNAAEDGRGYYMEAQGDNMMFMGMMYDDLAQPVWYTARGAMTTPTLFQATLFQSYNGQTINGAYDQPDISSSRGTIAVQFTSSTGAVLTEPSGRQTTLARYTFN
jgi:hypothetical protein